MTGEEVKIAQRRFLSVLYNGEYYDRITARIVKTVRGHDAGTYKEILCVRLLHERSNSVTEALAKDVDFTPEYYAEKKGRKRMVNILLEAKTKNEKLVLKHLKENATEALADKINSGKKTLSDCWNYIVSEARKQAESGCACIESEVVFGWAMHFFEEDAIKPSAGKAITATVKTPPKKKEKRKSEAKTKIKKADEPVQTSLFDFFGG